MFDARVGAVDVHAETIANQDSNHGTRRISHKARRDPDGDALAACECQARFTGVGEKFDALDPARPVAMPETRRYRFFTLVRLLPFEDVADIAVDDVAR